MTTYTFGIDSNTGKLTTDAPQTASIGYYDSTGVDWGTTTDLTKAFYVPYGDLGGSTAGSKYIITTGATTAATSYTIDSTYSFWSPQKIPTTRRMFIGQDYNLEDE